jgi:hypothetical protein
VAQPAAVATRDDDAGLQRLYTELEDDVLASYDRDEPPEVTTTTIDPVVGTARIGVGPGDVYIAGELAHAPSRWPLEIGHGTRTEVRSKHLLIQISADQSAAWIADELSWRIELCGRTTVVPLRITALYAHDGDRWALAFEHLSYGTPAVPDGLATKPIKTAAASAGLETALAAVIDRGLVRAPRDPAVLGTEPTATVLGPGAGDEWHGDDVVEAAIAAGKLGDRRVGTVGRSPREPTIAYWVGNYAEDLPATATTAAGTAHLRATFVFEKRPFATDAGATPDALDCARGRLRDGIECRWVLVQSHMSQPITDEPLAKDIFGDALISYKPLALNCADTASPPPN